jgi:hypothetical protein
MAMTNLLLRLSAAIACGVALSPFLPSALPQGQPPASVALARARIHYEDAAAALRSDLLRALAALDRERRAVAAP